jgi:methylmalonyl-CoA mutase
MDQWQKAAAKLGSRWQGRCGAELGDAEGIAVKPSQTSKDTKGLPYADTLPGLRALSCAARRPRCTRCGPGRSASTPVSRPPKTAIAFYRQALAAGGQGVSVAFDLATHRGYDSDHPRVIGRCRQGRRGDRFASRT